MVIAAATAQHKTASSANSAYVRSTYLPWGTSGDGSNTAAMDAVFGPGNWDNLFLQSTTAAAVFTPARHMVFLEGSDGGANDLNSFLQANRPVIENWVAAGGHLFLNAAPNTGSSFSFGFGGITLNYGNNFSAPATVAAGHPIAAGPFLPAGSSYSGPFFSHATVSGPGLTTVITGDNGIILGYKGWGSGYVFLGGMTTSNFHSPSPNGLNLRRNILAFTPPCTAPAVTAPAMAANATGQCSASLSLAATATNGGTLAYRIGNTAIASPYAFPVGTTTVSATATNACGSDTKNFTVTVTDNTAPVAVAHNITVALDASGNASITGAQVNNGSSDNCSVASLSVSPSTFACANVGPNAVTLTVTDASGNVSTASATVTVQSVLAVALAPTNSGCYNAHNGSITPTVTGGTAATYTWTGPNGFTAASPGLSNLAPGTYALTVTSAGGCSATASATITEPVNYAPQANADQLSAQACTPLIITPAMLLGNDTDPQGQPLQLADVLAPSSGSIAANGDGTYTFTPAAGFTGAVTFSYVAKKNDATVAYSGNGHFYEFVTANGVCWTDARAAAAGRSYLGMQGYLATVTSAGENAFAAAKLRGNGWIGASDEAVEGTWRWMTGPEAGTQFWQGLSNGAAVGGQYSNWSRNEPNNYPLEAAGEDYAHFYSGSGAWNDYPNCIGSNMQGYVVEYGGLESCLPTLTSTATVTVNVAPVAPTALAHDLTVSLDANGTATITAAQIDNQSTASCAITALSVAPATFGCANLGANTVTLTVTDATGTSNTATATVTVTDTTLPTITAPSNVTVSADAGKCSASNVALGLPVAADNCSATVSNDAPATFDKGTTTVTWTATDGAGNTATATQLVTVNDTEKPALTVPASIVANAPATQCGAVVTFAPLATDNCVGATVVASPASGSTFAVGTSTVTVTATDASGNTSTDSFTITVKDVTAPAVAVRNVTVTLVNGAASVTAADVNNHSTDACGIASYSLNRSAFSCANLGSNPVVLTVTDIHGNVASASATVTVVGSIPAPAITVTPASSVYTGGVATNLYLGYGAQSATLTAKGGVSYAWSPAAGLSSTTVANPVFTATTAGTFTYTVTATNEFGCTATKTVTLRVVDARCDKDKVVVCHNGHEICISPNAVPAHLTGHAGDQLGACETAARPAAPTATAELATELVFEAYPNPFGASTTVHFRPTTSAPAEVRVFDAVGRLVGTLFSGITEAGHDYALTLDGTHLAAGLYLCRYESQGEVHVQRLSVAK